MRKNIISLFVLAICLLSTVGSIAKQKQMKLRVLYLGGQVDWTHGEFGSEDHYKTQEDYQKAQIERMNAFGDLLRTYFTTVKTMPASEWKPELSNGYDVTIFDGTPPVLKETAKEYVFNGKASTMKIKHYLPEDFACPSITIASIGNKIGQPYGCKNDWLCLCLDANAHGMNLQHPIFKGPFKTHLTLKKQPTPADAMHYGYFQDWNVPDSVMMWEVNTKGYMTTKGFNIGMVSRPWGYMDSPDCEAISSGVCAKTIDAVALGRHANFFTWGFVGSPLYMTNEAKVVFANVVAYMSKYRGTPLVRKYIDRIATREYIKEVKYCCTRKYVEERAISDKAFYEELLKIGKEARAKKAKGEQLTNQEKMYVDYTENDIPKPKNYAETMQENHPELYAQFGDDEAKYLAYYDENAPYFYGGQGSYNLFIDTDTKTWQIPNNDKRLIEKAISCLETNTEVERANRILERYTLCDFKTPAEWRKWYNTYKDKMFFTESGGWHFMVNDKNAPGNDYTVAKKREAKENSANNFMNQAEVNHDNPLAINAHIEKLDWGGFDIVFDLKLMDGYHVYRTVDESDPYIPMKITFSLPEGAVLGDAYYPVTKPFVKDGTTIYEGKTTIRQNVKLQALPATIKCNIECQCCDANVCMPPYSKDFTLEVK